ncbi:hypothetical protein [Rhizobium sp. BK176]|uniref:hypothetical protein n=1 Tax=Rhizobium sp. BK176 TaxID=2587071 RepID=UPI0021675039|nr:hypothetical protein [Rhizobium sp. BK176]MCS4088570.1 hypothetical protein [Rhizobium sp. BK176]
MKLTPFLLSSVVILASFSQSLAAPTVAASLAFSGAGEHPPLQSSEFVDRALTSFKRYAGSDGVFDAKDVKRLAPLSARQASGFSKSDFERIHTLDLDGDGKVQKDEVEVWARDAFDAYDTDGNGSVAGGEIGAISKDFEPYRANAANANAPETVSIYVGEPPKIPHNTSSKCDFPDVDGATVVFVSKYEAGNLIDLAIAGLDTEADSAEVQIEPGAGPLYVVAQTFMPTVWRVTGDVSRVSRFVAVGINRGPDAGDGVGVSGLTADKVTFVAGLDCLPWTSDEAGRYKQSVELKEKLGKAPDKVVANYTMSTVSIPSGTFSEPNRGTPIDLFSMFPKISSSAAQSDAARNLSIYSPLGLLRIDPRSVVAPTKVQPYDVLPQQVGLLQLISDGQIVEQNGLYRIVKPIRRYPAGLTGALSVKFMICDGVPQPGGSPGHSEVLREVPMIADPVCEAHRG